jgi:plasmid stabilization system protein ParE
MDFQVTLNDRFVSDLKEIVDYLTSHADKELASRLGNELLDRAMGLGLNPFIGQPVKQRPGVRKSSIIPI